VPLAPQAPNLTRAISGATYRARVPALALDDARRSVSEFNEAKERFIDKTRKERSVSMDLKRLVGVVTLEDDPEDDSAPRGGVVLRFPVAFGPDGSVRPDEVLRGILGRAVDGASFVRERLHFDAAPLANRDVGVV